MKIKAVALFLMLSATLYDAAAAAEPSVESKDHRVPSCFSAARLFVDELWPKVGERICLKCHRRDGDAGESKLLLVDATDGESIRQNYEAFARLVPSDESGESRVVAKATGGLDHGGGKVVKHDATEYRLLEQFVRRVRATANRESGKEFDRPMDVDPETLFDGVEMISPQQLLRRVTLSLAGRLPLPLEVTEVERKGFAAFNDLLDDIMREEAFFARLKEGFNDIFLTAGYDGVGESVLSYNHFEKSRLWYQTHDLNDVPEAERQRTRWKLADVYRDALRREPMELIAFIVKHDRPFTEIVTADYIMVSPYSARGYGVFDAVHEQFDNPNDPFEYVPTRLNALRARNGTVQPTVDGFYPHAGLLSTFQYLRRYPTTETNRNRLRARMYYRHFLGTDVMALARA